MSLTRQISRHEHRFGHKPDADRNLAGARAGSSTPAATPLDTAPTVAIVPIGLLNRDTKHALETAVSMKTDEILAIHICVPDSRSKEREFEREWDEWNTGLTMVFLAGTDGDRSSPIVNYIRRQYATKGVFLVVSPAMPLRCELRATTTYNYATHLLNLLRDDQNVTICRSDASECSEYEPL